MELLIVLAVWVVVIPVCVVGFTLLAPVMIGRSTRRREAVVVALPARPARRRLTA